MSEFWFSHMVSVAWQQIREMKKEQKRGRRRMRAKNNTYSYDINKFRAHDVLIKIFIIYRFVLRLFRWSSFICN